MGEIPERNVFRQKYLAKALTPYFHLTQAVRIGDLSKFQETLAKYGNKFRKDKTYTLILRYVDTFFLSFMVQEYMILHVYFFV